MNNLLKNSYDKAERIRGKRLLYLLISIFIVFIIIGFSIGYFYNETLKTDDPVDTNPTNGSLQGNEHQGRVRAVSAFDYPGENINFGLYNESGLIILLKSRPDDLRLEVSNGLPVKITGSLSKTRDGTEDVLLIDQITYINESN